MCLLLPSSRGWAQSEDCSFFASPQTFNTFERDDGIIVIGHVRTQPYIVLSTTDPQANLPVIRTCVPDAFLTSSRLGSYIQVASFANYREAQDLAELISDSLGVDTRIIHRNRLGR
ncbi:hypothetical protein IQ260_27790 [Leptolyngbya cf. ectocarpi LEGE 11479]|uniref:Uncharacterized protein n=1 Tax=Leptolyngbya cf. ectocarpi LEGE 11479 TaxID=1828722 RepID=A0A928ZZV8_LEPEC|nr:hypothetical protein [Leptolyngbya ectocarpi]MBE9070451.1 hypothetical protein [Leptolyngbya cf. ectocarpi LEGE 11479]